MLTKGEVYYDWSDSKVYILFSDGIFYDLEEGEMLSVEKSDDMYMRNFGND